MKESIEWKEKVASKFDQQVVGRGVKSNVMILDKTSRGGGGGLEERLKFIVIFWG